MRTVYILLGIFGLYALLCLCGCSLFRKTTKTTNSATFDLSKQKEVQNLDLKTRQKETQVYSYWKDSIFYQYELVKEQVDQAKASTVRTQENQETKQEKTIKESKPLEAWIYAAIIIGIVGFILIFKKLNLQP